MGSEMCIRDSIWGAYFDGLQGDQEDKKRATSSSEFEDDKEDSSIDRTDASTLEDISGVKENFETPKTIEDGVIFGERY